MVFYQCTMNLIISITEFLNLVQGLQEFANSYHKTFVKTHHELEVNNLLRKHHRMINTVRDIKTFQSEYLTAIHNKLKPLHGYPGNKALLDNIEHEMAESIQNIHNNELINMEILETYKVSGIYLVFTITASNRISGKTTGVFG